jgi:hypothetical protein
MEAEEVYKNDNKFKLKRGKHEKNKFIPARNRGSAYLIAGGAI